MNKNMNEVFTRLRMNSIILATTLQLLLAYGCQCVEVHFESADSGFFLKHSRQPPVAPEISTSQSSPVPPLRSRTTYDSVLSVDRFTVVQTTQAVSIRASYGPFSTKQTVPARYIVPDTIENQHDYMNNTTAALIELQQTNLHLDISAHLVSSYVSQDSPVLRVLFHAGADPGGHLQRQKICVLLHVSSGNQVPIKGRCMPEGEDGVCVAEVVIPFNWFHTLSPMVNKENANSTPVKVPQRFVQVSYSVFEPPVRNPEQCEPKVQIQPLTSFVQVPLVAPVEPFKEFQIDESLVILLPQQPLYPMSKFHVPVYLQYSEKNISSFTVKARVKSGIKALGATSSSEMWNISIERDNSKHSTVRVTALKKKHEKNGENNSTSQTIEDRIEEIFTWLFEVADDTKELIDGGKIVWSVTYIYDNPRDSSLEISPDESKKRIIAKLEVNKDDIQAVLPMAKNWELMNTAVLTGRQVAQAMKVFIVSQGGKVADVTLQSSCYAEDESVIKVSSSCSSVYVDGSEIRGSSNASIIVKYGTYIGLAKFIVWMPEFPLEVYISDFRLSQIKGWKVVDEHQYLHKKSRRKKRSFFHGQHNAGYFNNGLLDKMSCRARYQQSPVEVYARFVAVDQNSGRISYFISRRTGLRVTDLVQPLLRVADPKIAILKGRILQGKSMGRTDVQVLSPITGRVIGTKEIRVGSDKVSLVKLSVRVVSGLQLTITPDNTIENGYIAETAVTHKLTAQYQEGLLDIDLEFSDGSRTPLRDISVDDYFLLVESLDTEVVAFAPMLASHHPRVIAVGEGNGNLLRVTLLLSEDCRLRRNVMSTKQTKYNTSPLASALAAVDVDFNNANDIINKHEVVQNDGIIYRKEKNKYVNSGGDLADIIGIPLRDSSHHHEPTVQARQHHGNSLSTDKTHFVNKKVSNRNMSSIEVGMYVLLTAFCFAIVVFVISCVVYASKFKAVHIESGLDSGDISKASINVSDLNRESKFLTETTTNAHDWVWLGRSTMDRSSMLTFSCQGQNFINPRDSRIRITANPIVSCSANNISISKATSIHDPNETAKIEMIDQSNKPISDHNTDIELKPNEYRPPVPPHRNIAIKHPSSYNCSNLSNQPVCVLPMSTRNNVSFPHTESSTLFDDKHYKISDQHSPNCLPKRNATSNKADPKSLLEEKHNAEKLVESANHKMNAFQFDTLTPNKKQLGAMKNTSRTGISKNEHQSQRIDTHSDLLKKNDPNVFIKPEYGQSQLKSSRVKRATVVGNPMFSSTADDGNDDEECLSLDDLDMDYEQIMHYFDNLKESNA